MAVAWMLASLLIGASGAAAPIADASSGTRFVSRHFVITLAPGWRVTKSREEPDPKMRLGEGRDVALEATGKGGWALRLLFACPITEMGGDAIWDMRPDDSRRRVKDVARRDLGCTIASKKACHEQAGGKPDVLFWCDLCMAGDGRFDLIAIFEGAGPFAAGWPCFLISNTRTETPDLSPVERMLRSFSVEGAVGAPDPTQPAEPGPKRPD